MSRLIRSFTRKVHTLVFEFTDDELGELFAEMENNPKGRAQVALYQAIKEYRELPDAPGE